MSVESEGLTDTDTTGAGNPNEDEHVAEPVSTTGMFSTGMFSTCMLWLLADYFQPMRLLHVRRRLVVVMGSLARPALRRRTEEYV